MSIEFKPKIVAFCCNWCSYAGADLAGSSRLSYPADVKIIRVPCSCRVNPMFILRAFEKGADGVILCGCHPGDCHYSTGNYYARRRMKLLFSMLDFLGIEKGRCRVEWVSAAEGAKFSATMNEFVKTIYELGEASHFWYTERKGMMGYGLEKELSQIQVDLENGVGGNTTADSQIDAEKDDITGSEVE